MRCLEEAVAGGQAGGGLSQGAAGNCGAEAGRGGEINSEPPPQRNSSPPLTCSPSQATALRSLLFGVLGEPHPGSTEAQLRVLRVLRPLGGLPSMRTALSWEGDAFRASPGSQDRRKPASPFYWMALPSIFPSAPSPTSWPPVLQLPDLPFLPCLTACFSSLLHPPSHLFPSSTLWASKLRVSLSPLSTPFIIY